MSTSIVYYSGNLRTESTHLESGENYITDAPTDNKGKGKAFSPTDLIATGLANCMLTIMGIVARRESLEIEGTRAEVTKIMGKNPRCIRYCECSTAEIITECGFSCPCWRRQTS